MGTREPAVAGQFYAGSAASLSKQIEACFMHELGPKKLPKLQKGRRKVRGLVVPHAGYMYSGPVAAHAYALLAEEGFPEFFVIIGPNHTGMGAGVSATLDDFVTPLGRAENMTEITKKLIGTEIMNDPVAHTYEHSVEVQIPFLQYISPSVRIVPIVMMSQDMDTAIRAGETIKNAIEGHDCVVIASTDFSHYVPKAVAYEKDKKAINAILEGEIEKFYATVRRERVSMCGYGPVAAMMTAVKPSHAELLKYATSGDISPMMEVVGYASIAFY